MRQLAAGGVLRWVACLVPRWFEIACLPAVADGLRHVTLYREDSNAIAQRLVQLIDHASDPAKRIANVVSERALATGPIVC